MALLTSLKLVAALRANKASPTVQRRNKILKQLVEQIAMAKAAADGVAYAATKQKKVLDTETGQRVVVTVPKRVKPWHWTDSDGKIQLAIFYGPKIIELAKGKNAIEVEPANLLKTLELIKKAVEAGELDTQIEAAATATKHNFKA